MKYGAILAIFLCAGATAYAQFLMPVGISSRGSINQGQPVATLTVQPRPDAGRFSPPSKAPYTSQPPENASAFSSFITGEINYRDADGRQRTDRVVQSGPAGQLRIVEILDPLVGSYYLLDPQRKIAYRMHFDFPAPQPYKPTPPLREPRSTTLPNGTRVTHEYLGSKFFGTVEAEGERNTSVYPAGLRGNDRPITEVQETWRATSLGLIVQTISKGPNGESTGGAMRITTVNPPLNLFLVPAGYAVEDRSGTFTVEIGNRPDTPPPAPPTRPIGPSTAMPNLISRVDMNLRGSRDKDGNVWGQGEIRVTQGTILTGAPFSAEQSEQSEQILADGTHQTPIVRLPVKMYRDSQGRTRLDRTLIPPRPVSIPSDKANDLVVSEITDPVSGYFYFVDIFRKIAYRVKVDPPLPAAAFTVQPPAPVPPGAKGPPVTIESLGTKLIQGVEAEGERRTTTYTPGPGRNAALVTEVWSVPRLHLIVLRTSAQSSGSSKLELTGLSLASPPADLFAPPQGFQVIDVPTAFSIEFGRHPPGAVVTGSFSSNSNLGAPPLP